MTDLAPDYFTKHVSEVDPEVADVLVAEARRQETTLEMIASENFVPQAVMDCHGSTLTNKYAEGLPGKRYYGGREGRHRRDARDRGGEGAVRRGRGERPATLRRERERGGDDGDDQPRRQD